MRTLSKVVLIIVIITLLYSVAKLINAKSNKNQQVATKTWSIKKNNQSMQTNQNTAQNSQPTTNASTQTTTAQNAQQVPPTPDTPNAQGLYQADEVLIDGQGKAGSNYIDITSDTPITPQPQNNNVQNNTQNNNYNNNGGAYAEASVNIDNNTTTSQQQYAPGVPAFEVLDGD